MTLLPYKTQTMHFTLKMSKPLQKMFYLLKKRSPHPKMHFTLKEANAFQKIVLFPQKIVVPPIYCIISLKNDYPTPPLPKKIFYFLKKYRANKN